MSARHKVLGVARNASEAEVKSAYRKLARGSHPDQHPGDRLAARRWQELQTAYQEYRSEWADEGKDRASEPVSARNATESPVVKEAVAEAKDLARPFATGMIGIIANLVSGRIGTRGGLIVEVAGKAGQAAVGAAADRARAKVDELLRKP